MARPGDRIVMRAKTKRLAPAARWGEILEVLNEDPPRYLVRWGDGRQTMIAPLPDSVRIEPAGSKPKATAKRSEAARRKGAAKPKGTAAKPKSTARGKRA